MTTDTASAPAPGLGRRSWKAFVALLLLLALLAGVFPAAPAGAEEVPPDEPPTEEPPGPVPPSSSPNWPLELVSRGPGGIPGDAGSFDASISADGSTVAFASTATNLGPDTTPVTNGGNVFARSLATGTNELASVDFGGGRMAFPRHTALDRRRLDRGDDQGYEREPGAVPARPDGEPGR